MHMLAQIPCGIHAQIGVVAVHFHAQIQRIVGHLGTDRAQADHAQHLAADLGPHKLLFAFFHAFGHVVTALQALAPLRGLGQIAAAGDQAAQHQLGHGIGVGTGGVEHHNALFAAFIQRDIIYTGTGAGNGLQVFAQLHLVHIGTAHQNAVRIGAFHQHLKLIGGQLAQANGRNGIQRFNGKHFYRLLFCFQALALRKSSINCTSLSTPSLGMAL